MQPTVICLTDFMVSPSTDNFFGSPFSCEESNENGRIQVLCYFSIVPHFVGSGLH